MRSKSKFNARFSCFLDCSNPRQKRYRESILGEVIRGGLKSNPTIGPWLTEPDYASWKSDGGFSCAKICALLVSKRATYALCTSKALGNNEPLSDLAADDPNVNVDWAHLLNTFTGLDTSAREQKCSGMCSFQTNCSCWHQNGLFPEERSTFLATSEIHIGSFHPLL